MKKVTLYSVVLLAFFLLVQSFQCASSEMTTAKIAVSQKDWSKATTNLEKELQKNPNNGEAWYMLGRVRREQQDLKGMAQAFNEAQKYAKDKIILDDIANQTYVAWGAAYNKSIEKYNASIDEADKSKRNAILTEAVESAEMAASLRPENTEIYGLLSTMYSSTGDTVKSMQALEKYLEAEKPNINFMLAKNLTLEMPRTQVIAALGAPNNTKGARLGKDSVLVDIYNKLEGKESYVFYRQEKTAPTMIDKDKSQPSTSFSFDGIRTNVPPAALAGEKERYVPFDSRSFVILAFSYYEKDKSKASLEKTLKILETALKLKPNDEDASRLRFRILEETGKSGDALASIEDLAKKFPNNTAYLVQYGSMLGSLKRYDDAITQYDKVIAIDPKNESALFNLGATYKNKASVLQKEESDKKEADKKYKENEARYFHLLLKAADYFERYRNLPNKQRDFVSAEQLINTYVVLRDDAKIKRLAGELVALEPFFQDDPSYYDMMFKLYASKVMNDAAKAKEYDDKAQKLRNK